MSALNRLLGAPSCALFPGIGASGVRIDPAGRRAIRSIGAAFVPSTSRVYAATCRAALPPGRPSTARRAPAGGSANGAGTRTGAGAGFAPGSVGASRERLLAKAGSEQPLTLRQHRSVRHFLYRNYSHPDSQKCPQSDFG
jgi:hypothetical protein